MMLARLLAALSLSLVACAAAPRRPTPAPACPACPELVAVAADAVASVDRVPFGADDRAAELAVLRDALRDAYAHLEIKQQQWGVELDAVYRRYEPEIRAAETWARYEWVMAGFVAELHDAHVQWRRKRAPSERKRRIVRLGLDTRFAGAELIVAGVWPGSAVARAGLRPGDKLVAIDGDTIEQRLGAQASVRSWSRAEAARHDFAASWPASRNAVDAEPRARRLTRELDDGRYETLEVVPETTPRPGGRPPAIELAWRGDVAVLHVRTLEGRVAETTKQASTLAAAIFARPQGLVIDLRDNDGGYEDGARAIAARLTAKPVIGGATRVRLSPQARAAHKVWRDLAEDPAKPGWSQLQPIAVDGLAPRDYPARIAVVIDAGCRSSCETLALLLRAMGARLYGERTGGASGAPITVVLPSSGARVGIPARASFDLGERAIEGHGVAPDEAVAATRADLAAGRDAALERAVAHVCSRGARGC